MVRCPAAALLLTATPTWSGELKSTLWAVAFITVNVNLSGHSDDGL